MKAGLVDFPNFAQGFDFASREAISEAREFSKTHQVGFRPGCDTGVEICGKSKYPLAHDYSNTHRLKSLIIPLRMSNFSFKLQFKQKS